MGTVLLATDGSEYARRAADHAALSVGEVLAIARERGVSATGDTRHGEPHEVISAVAGSCPPSSSWSASTATTTGTSPGSAGAWPTAPPAR